MKKFYAAVLVFALVLNLFFNKAICANDYEDAKDTAQITFNSVSPSGNGFDLVETGTSKEHSVAVVGGENCWLLDSQSGESNAYINFVLADNIKNNNNDGSVYEITVEYYDVVSGFFNLYYDAQKRETQRADTVYMTNTASWKKAKFVLDDTNFNKRIDGKYDFRLSIKQSGVTSETSIPIKGITVVRKRGVNPIWVTSESDKTGNAFEWFSDRKIIKNKFKNLTDREMNVKVIHNIISKQGYKAYSKEENMTFSPNEERDEIFDFSELERCDVYYYIIKIVSDTDGINSELKNMELAIVKTDPNGIKDDIISYNAHFGHTSDVLAHEAMWDILKLSNAEGTREGVQWSYVETTKGVLNWDGITALSWEGLRKSGLSPAMCLFQHSPSFYSGGGTLPFTDDEFEAWRKYIRFAVEKVKDINSRYEIWNEPNTINFNKLLDQRRGDVYTKAFIAAVEEIKKIDPNAKVGGLSLTGIQYDSGQKYWKETLDAGFAKYADAIVLHPYTTASFESAKQVDVIKRYKDEFIAAGGKDPEIWHTEIGFTKADSFVGTYRMQGALNARSVIQMCSGDVADKVCLYNLEEKGTVLTDREQMFGMISSKFEPDTKLGKRCIPRESFLEITALGYILANSKIKSTHNSDDENLFISRFKSQKFGKDVVTFNTDKKPQSITLDLGCAEITLFDEYGNESILFGKDGKYTFVADSYPKYILGDVKKVNVVKSEDISPEEEFVLKGRIPSGEKGKMISLIITDSNCQFNEEGFRESIIYIDQSLTDNDGKFELAANIPNLSRVKAFIVSEDGNVMSFVLSKNNEKYENILLYSGGNNVSNLSLDRMDMQDLMVSIDFGTIGSEQKYSAVCALYNNNMLAECKVFEGVFTPEVSARKEKFSFNVSEYDALKIMIYDDFLNLKPLCDMYIKRSEDITPEDAFVVKGRIPSGERDKMISLIITDSDLQFNEEGFRDSVIYIDQSLTNKDGKFKLTANIPNLSQAKAFVVSEDGSVVNFVISKKGNKNDNISLYSEGNDVFDLSVERANVKNSDDADRFQSNSG